jgi:UDP-N-acetylmuramoyl-tripeptide--D-alanyl-D-alanine ligase
MLTIEELHAFFLKHRTISTDSRQVVPGSLFFALKGDNFDGNKYAQVALEAGAAYAVIDDPIYEGQKTLLVNDVLQSLQLVAQLHRRKSDIPVIAITGSNGKTTTKELINAVLSSKYKVTATKGNLNNHIGVPLTLLGITNETEIAIIEMGANHQGEIAQLCKLAEPTHGLITNIGKAHLGGFGGYEGVIKAKSEMYGWLKNSASQVFLNGDNPLLVSLSVGIKSIKYGTQAGNSCRGEARENSGMLSIDWFPYNKLVSIDTNLVGSYNFENAMAAICIGDFFDVPPHFIKSAISSYSPSNSRSQALKTTRNSIILDAYNANPTSMDMAIENFRHSNAPHKMAILGDMLELGDESFAEHQEIVNLVNKYGFEKVVLVGPEFAKVADVRCMCFATSDEVFEWLNEQHLENYSILIKGSRGIKMEKILPAL